MTVTDVKNVNSTTSSNGVTNPNTKKAADGTSVHGNDIISDNKLSFDELLSKGIIKESGSGMYTYTPDGSMTYGEIKEMLGFEGGRFSEYNPSVKGSDDDYPGEDVKEIKLNSIYLPGGVPMQDADGKDIPGFYKTADGSKAYYKFYSGDNPEVLGKEVDKNPALKDYDGYETRQNCNKAGDYRFIEPGERVELAEKGWLGKFFSWIGSLFS